MTTELLIYHRPASGGLIDDISYDYESSVDLDTGGDGSGNYSYRSKNNTNETVNKAYQRIVRPSSGESVQSLSIDLYENTSIPVTYNILDIREPEKRKTSWSKTVTIPGTKNNNRIFGHIYEISTDGWVTIGNTTIYEGFNPNLKKEIVLLNDGVQVLKGNLQLKRIKKDTDGNIEYEIALSGELTSLFYDVGKSKLRDLDWSEWDHNWSKTNMKKSWGGVCIKDGVDFDSIEDYGSNRAIYSIEMQQESGRVLVTTTVGQSWQEEDWVRIDLTGVNTSGVDQDKLRRSIGSSRWYYAASALEFGYGNEFQIAQRLSSTQFTINWPWPLCLPASGVVMDNTVLASTAVRRRATGKGYVYPMIDWGLRYDQDSFPVQSFVPGFYVKEIWDKIMDETNSKYDSDFLDSQFFKRLMIIEKKKGYELNVGEFNSRKFQVGLTQSYLTGASYRRSQFWYWMNNINPGENPGTASIWPTVYSNRVPFQAEVGFSGTSSFYDNGRESDAEYGNWDQDNHRWVVHDTGEYNLTATVNLSAWVDMNGYVNQAADGTASFTPFSANVKYYPNHTETSYSSPFNKMQVRVEMLRKRAGTVTIIGSTERNFQTNNNSYYTGTSSVEGSTNPNWPFFGRYQPADWNNTTVSVNQGVDDYFNKNDEVWVEVKYKIWSSPTFNSVVDQSYSCITFGEIDNSGMSVDRKNIRGDWYLKVNKQSFVANRPNDQSSEGDIIPAASFLPSKLTCRDFILAITKMFNLYIQQDANIDRKYYIEPRDDFYYDGASTTHFEDWTDKIDEDSVEMEPLGELAAKNYIFQNQKETDHWNKKFTEDRGREYMSYTYEVQNDFLKNDKKITVPLGSTVMTNMPEGSDVVVPSIYQFEKSTGTVKPLSNAKPRILIWSGLKPYTFAKGGNTDNWWELVSQANTGLPNSNPYYSYPYAGTVDSPSDPIYDINWYNMEEDDFVYWDSARWTNDNLFNRYYRNMMLEIADPASKVIYVDVELRPTDIFELDFRKIYVIDGQWLRLQKIIDYNAAMEGMTRCEFLKLRSPSRFKRNSLVVDVLGNVGVDRLQEDNSGSIPVTWVEKPPIKKKPNTGYTNNVPGGQVGGNATIDVNGLSNNVASGTKNVRISGNENSVGDNARNISISGGDGNRVLGGVNNVNIIGTSKVYVQESDVTYINGVRYKNGVAISKANVINANLDQAYIPQSETTTANVVNGCEDVVINAGTRTYENVINSGEDMILPDLPELGISTDTSPNPRTNAAGGFQILSPTASQVEIVRDTIRYRSI